MPPEEEKKRPLAKETEEVTEWIENRLKVAITSHTKKEKQPLIRRLSNFEYENTIRDLFGFHLDLNDNLPDDPQKPYRFNNTADFMLLGPEQMDRYLENARQVMASAIVDPEKPEVDYLKREWKPYGLDRGMGLDEFGLWGNRRGSPAGGMGLKSFPQRGEFKIRLQASAILPPGISGVTLSLIMGETIALIIRPKELNQSVLFILQTGLIHPKFLNFVAGLKTFLSPKEGKKMEVRNPIRG